MAVIPDKTSIPGSNIKTKKMPGHWLLARLGKRVLRPGGIELTRAMLNALQIGDDEDVVEFAPGLGITTQLVLARNPHVYTAVERDADAACQVNARLNKDGYRCVVADAADTGLPDASASVVYGEAMLTMQSEPAKQAIVAEATRVLCAGGRYGIHEIMLMPEDIDASTVSQLEEDLSKVIGHGVRPLRLSEWTTLFNVAGLKVVTHAIVPMHLLEPRRIIQDEGLGRALRFAWNVAMNRKARKRVMNMRRVFRKYEPHLVAIMLIGEKSDD